MVVKSLTQLDCWILDVTKKKIEGPWKIQVLTQLVEKTRISPALVPSKKTPKRCCALWILEWGSSHETLISNPRWRWLCDKDLVAELFAFFLSGEKHGFFLPVLGNLQKNEKGAFELPLLTTTFKKKHAASAPEQIKSRKVLGPRFFWRWFYLSLAISEDCQRYLFLGGKEVGFQSYAINSSVSLMPWQPQGNFAEIAGLEYRQKRLFLEEKSPENVSLMTFSPIFHGQVFMDPKRTGEAEKNVLPIQPIWYLSTSWGPKNLI